LSGSKNSTVKFFKNSIEQDRMNFSFARGVEDKSGARKFLTGGKTFLGSTLGNDEFIGL